MGADGGLPGHPRHGQADRPAVHPEKIILLGSYAYGTPTENSDVDLMVVMNYRGREHAKALEILRAVRPPFSIDLLVRRPGATSRRYREFDPLVRGTLDRGKSLYERNGN